MTITIKQAKRMLRRGRATIARFDHSVDCVPLKPVTDWGNGPDSSWNVVEYRGKPFIIVDDHKTKQPCYVPFPV